MWRTNELAHTLLTEYTFSVTKALWMIDSCAASMNQLLALMCITMHSMFLFDTFWT